MENPTNIQPEDIEVGQRIRYRLKGELIWTATVVEIAPNRNHDKIVATDVDFTSANDRSLIALSTGPAALQALKIYSPVSTSTIEVI